MGGEERVCWRASTIACQVASRDGESGGDDVLVESESHNE